MNRASDDPRIAAYVLGELSPSEKVAFERDMAESEEIGLEVEVFRALCEQLKESFGNETQPGLRPEQREKVLSLTEERKSRVAPRRRFWLRIAFGLASFLLIMHFLSYLKNDIERMSLVRGVRGKIQKYMEAGN